jgi:hypothetical protein
VRRLVLIFFGLFWLTNSVGAQQLSPPDLKNLLARIRENRVTQADFQEQRFLRLMKKPIVSSGRVWFQPPNKFRREAGQLTQPNGERRSSPLDLLSEF